MTQESLYGSLRAILRYTGQQTEFEESTLKIDNKEQQSRFMTTTNNILEENNRQEYTIINDDISNNPISTNSITSEAEISPESIIKTKLRSVNNFNNITATDTTEMLTILREGEDDKLKNQLKARQQLQTKTLGEDENDTIDKTKYDNDGNNIIVSRDIPIKFDNNNSDIKINFYPRIAYAFNKIANDSITNVSNIFNSDFYNNSKEIQNGIVEYYKKPDKSFKKETKNSIENPKLINTILYKIQKDVSYISGNITKTTNDLKETKEENTFLKQKINKIYEENQANMNEIKEYMKETRINYEESTRLLIEQNRLLIEQNEMYKKQANSNNGFGFNFYTIGVPVACVIITGSLIFIRDRRQRVVIENMIDKKLLPLVTNMNPLMTNIGEINNIVEEIKELKNVVNEMKNGFNGLQGNIVKEIKNGFDELKSSIVLLAATSIDEIKGTSEKLLKCTCDSLMNTVKGMINFIKSYFESANKK